MYLHPVSRMTNILTFWFYLPCTLGAGGEYFKINPSYHFFHKHFKMRDRDAVSEITLCPHRVAWASPGGHGHTVDTQWTPISSLLGLWGRPSGVTGLALPAPHRLHPEDPPASLSASPLSPGSTRSHFRDVISTLQGHLRSQAQGLPSAASQWRQKRGARRGRA